MKDLMNNHFGQESERQAQLLQSIDSEIKKINKMNLKRSLPRMTKAQELANESVRTKLNQPLGVDMNDHKGLYKMKIFQDVRSRVEIPQIKRTLNGKTRRREI